LGKGYGHYSKDHQSSRLLGLGGVLDVLRNILGTPLDHLAVVSAVLGGHDGGKDT